MEFRFDYRCVPTIARFANDQSFIRGVMGPFGSGKSSGCVAEIVMRSIMQRKHRGISHTRWAVVRNTYPQLRDTTLKTWLAWLPDGVWGTWHKTERTYVIDRIPGVRAEVIFKALDTAKEVRDLLSLELTGAWINEAREIDQAIFEGIQGRLRRYPRTQDGGFSWSGLIMDTNPPDDDSWWYEFFEERKPPNARIFRQPGGLSPEAENLPNLHPRYYADLAVGKTPEFVKVYIDGQYGSVQDGMAVYSGTWSDGTHVRECSPTPGLPLLIGMDFGLTPSAAIAQLTPAGQLRVLDELVTEDLGVRRFVEQVLRPHLAKHYQGYRVECSGDPAGLQRAQTDEKTVFQIIADAGLHISAPHTNDVTSRLEAVRWFLTRLADGQPALILDPRCKTLRKGFNGGYRFRRLAVSGPERYMSAPDKNRFSHVHDALQYLALRVRSGGGSQTHDASNSYQPQWYHDL
jgi:hypothetical protein